MSSDCLCVFQHIFSRTKFLFFEGTFFKDTKIHNRLSLSQFQILPDGKRREKTLILALRRIYLIISNKYSRDCVKQPLQKTPKIGFQDQLSLNAGQSIEEGEHSARPSTFIKQPFVIKIFVVSIFEWPFYCTIYFKNFTWPLYRMNESVANACGVKIFLLYNDIECLRDETCAKLHVW